LTDLTGLKRGTLNLAASQTVANYWLPPLMCRFHEAAPGVKLALVIGNTEAVVAMVHEGTVDLGFVEGEIDDPVLSITPVAEDELILVTAPNDGAKRRAPTSAELKAMRWVSRERGSATRELFEAALAEHGIRASDLDLAFELPSNEAVRAAVESGAGAAVLSRQVVAASLKAGSLVVLRLALSKRRFYMLRHKERYASQAARKMLSLITPIDQTGNSRRPKTR
jgi:DNA-binding transcriptional LysR family regulator